MNKMIKNIMIMAIIVIVAVSAVLVMPLMQPSEPQIIYSDDPIVTSIEPTPAPDASGGEKFIYKLKRIFSSEPEYTIIEPTPDPALLSISKYMAADVVEVELNNEFGELIIYFKNDLWYAKGYEDVEIDQAAARNIAYTSAYVSAETIITEDISDKEEYGIDGTTTVTAKYSDGVEQTFIVGNKSPNNSEYYMMLEGMDKIFTVWTNYYNNANTKFDELRKLSSIDIIVDEIAEVTITNTKGETVTFGKTDPNNDVSLGIWEVKDPFIQYMNGEVLFGDGNTSAGILAAMVAVKGSEVIEGDANDISKYGFDKPLGSISITNLSGYTVGYTVADYGEKYKYALMFDGDSNVYSVSNSGFSFLDTSAFKLIDKMISLINVAVVDRLDINLPGVKTIITIDHVLKVDEDGKMKPDANGNESFDHEYSIDGTSMVDEAQAGDADDDGTPKEQATWFYQDIIGMNVQRFVDEDDEFVKGMKLGSINFILNSEYMDKVTFDYYNFDENYYAVSKNKEDTYYLVYKKDIVRIARRYSELKEGNLDRGY